jgi:hypothetical protein
VRRRQGVGQRDLARDVLAVGEQDDYARAAVLAAERVRGELQRVVERRPVVLVDRERAQRVVRLGGRGRERAQLHRPRAERDHGDAVGGRLRVQELPRRGECVVELRARHRARAVDRDHHAFRGGEVHGVQADDLPAVLGHRRRRGSGRRGDHGDAHRREAARVDAAQRQRGAGPDGNRQGGDDGGSEQTARRSEAHSKPP